MTDVHCHIRGGDPAIRELVCGERFVGVHPWEVASLDAEWTVASLRSRLLADPGLGVGEIGLDRLREREISPRMREVFEAQLRLGVELGRPVTLHGAKCWGQVLDAVLRLRPRTSAFLFHGFSRSGGLLPDIARLGGFVSVGPAVLNDHAVNYRELVKRIPDDCLVLETDRTADDAAECPGIPAVAAKVAELRGRPLGEIEALTDANAERFCDRLPSVSTISPG